MDNPTHTLPPLLTVTFLSAILFAGFSVFGSAHANPLPQTPQQQVNNSTQLAHSGHHRHRHWRGDRRGRVYGPGYHRHRGVYWTGWRTYYRYGRRCARNCLVDRWTGRVIRCQQRCFY